MIVIGINGHTGAGKTTTSNLLFQDKNRQIVHLDSIFDDIKTKYFKNDISVLERESGENSPYLKNDSKLKKIAQLKYIKDLYIKLKEVYAFNIIKNIIKEGNVDYLIVEGRTLDIYNIDKLCDYKIFISLSRELRYKRVLKRDEKGLDSANVIKNFNEDSNNPIEIQNYMVINNYGDLEYLKEEIKKVENEIKQKVKTKTV